MGITRHCLSDFDVRRHKMISSARQIGPFLLQGLTWASLGLWTQNNPQVVGTSPGHGPQLTAQNRLSKSFGPERQK